MSQELPFEPEMYVVFPSGRLALADIAAIFHTMPYELDFVNEHDEYVWYSPNSWRDDHRLQKRLNHSVLGCHPQRVVPYVKKVLASLHTGKQDMVESPQVMNGHRTLIRYYAIRDKDGHYRGTLQVTEDVEHICQLCEQDTFNHGIVEGQVTDGVTTASINEKLADTKADAGTGPSVKDKKKGL
jgi:DUF438 domain-containing protein